MICGLLTVSVGFSAYDFRQKGSCQESKSKRKVKKKYKKQTV